jgi:hypothetical protein
MAPHSIPSERLTENRHVLVRGHLGFARLRSRYEGEALAKRVASQKALGRMYVTTTPYTTARLTQAAVIPADQANPTTEELYVNERLYDSKAHPETGKNFSIDSKGYSLPVIAVAGPDGRFTQDTSDKELAQGLDVTFVLTVYKPKDYEKRGLELSQVLVNEPVRYFERGNVSTDALAARGIVFTTPPVPVAADAAGAPADDEGNGEPDEAVPADSVIDESGLAFPAPAARSAIASPGTTPEYEDEPAAETPEQKIARLEAEIAASKSGSDSAVGANPWGNGIRPAF